MVCAASPSGPLLSLKAELDACTRCPLGRTATQGVPGEGPATAHIMLVGEQPGDQEDISGRPFVGPAGRLLDEALLRVGVERRDVYVTNAVKHFKFTLRGKRRLHQTPTASEIDHCRWWLDLERQTIKPALIVALGASALRGVLGRSTPVNAARGRLTPLGDGAEALATVHPSYLLRLTDPEQKRAEWRRFLDDLRLMVSQS